MSQFKPKPFLPFTDARARVRSLGLKSAKEWRQFIKTNRIADVPANPDARYVGEWQSWGDWLGTGEVASRSKVFRSFSDARRWVRENGITSDKQWREAVNAGRVPSDIPRNLRHNYKAEWTTSGDFYGTGFVAYTRRRWATFYEARRWASEHGITCREDWISASKAKLLPHNIPAHPMRVYPECEGGWAALFDNAVRGGSSFVEEVLAHELKPFLEINRTVRTINISRSRRKRIDLAIPSEKLLIEYDGWHWHRETEEKDRRETKALKNRGWRVVRLRESPLAKITDDDCVVSPKSSIHRRVVELLEHLLRLGIIPVSRHPDIKRYAASRRLLTAGTALAYAGAWRDFASARDWVQGAAIKTSAEFRRYAQENRLPNDIPLVPYVVYQADWRGWGEFLGTGRGPKQWRSFEAAREWATQSGVCSFNEWKQAARADGFPGDIPRNPSDVYKSAWVSWPHFLGKPFRTGCHEWRSFRDARAWAWTSGAGSEAEWRKLIKRSVLPIDVPKAPSTVYRKVWRGWEDWLGTERTEAQKSRVPFETARRYARSLRLRSEKEWRDFKATHALPKGVPRKPEHSYRNSGWRGFRDWLVEADE